MNTKNKRRLIAIICILLIFVYTSALLLPHSHEGDDENCAACAFLRSSSGILAAFVLYLTTCFDDGSLRCKLDMFRNALILHDSAPVWLKVKLSD